MIKNSNTLVEPPPVKKAKSRKAPEPSVPVYEVPQHIPQTLIAEAIGIAQPPFKSKAGRGSEPRLAITITTPDFQRVDLFVSAALGDEIKSGSYNYKVDTKFQFFAPEGSDEATRVEMRDNSEPIMHGFKIRGQQPSTNDHVVFDLHPAGRVEAVSQPASLSFETRNEMATLISKVTNQAIRKGDRLGKFSVDRVEINNGLPRVYVNPQPGN